MKKLYGLILGLVFSMTIFSGCGTSKQDTVPTYGEAAEIKVAVLGSAEQFKAREDFFIGMDLAINELKESGMNFSYEKIEDGASRDSGVALAKDVAKNSKYTLAFTLQTQEVVEVIADIFNEAKKTLLILSENSEKTMNKGYEYVLSGIVSAEGSSKALVEFCVVNGIKWVASSHSTSEYELALAKEFNNAVSNSKTVHLIDSTSGPYRASEFSNVWSKWSTLGVQAILVSFEDVEWASELISAIKSQNKDIVILGDAKFNNLEMMHKYKDALEGMIVAGSYGVASDEKLQNFYKKYEKKVMSEKGFDITSVTAQAYDFVHMIAQSVKKSANVQEFIKNMKSSEGYPGVTDIKFNAKGQLDEIPDYWIVKDGQMYRLV